MLKSKKLLFWNTHEAKKDLVKKTLAKKYGVSPSSVKRIVSRAKRNRGEPYARRGHKKRKLSKKKKNVFVLT